MTTTLILANYKAEKVSEGLLIKSVELSRETTKETRPDFLRDLNTDTFKQFLVHYNRRVAAGKVGAFVLLDHGGPGVGRILNLRISGKELIADILITTPEVIRKVEAGELTERSIEWGWSEDDAQLKGIALLSGDFGQDSEGWADLTVDVTKAQLEKEFKLDTLSMKYKVPTMVTNTKESKMALSPEDLEQIASMIAEAMASKIEDPEIDEDELKEEDISTEDDVQEAAEKMVAGFKSKMESMQRDTTINAYVINLASKDAPYSQKQLTKMFKAKKTAEGMEELFKRLSAMKSGDVQLEIETEWEGPSMDKTLKAEHKNYCAKYNSTIDFDTFSTISQGKNRVDLSNKSINVIK